MNVVQSQRSRDRARHAKRATRKTARTTRRGARQEGRSVKPPEERRRDILHAAQRLFVDQGFNETTVQDIAAAAGVATGTVYLYFGSKDEVLLALHRRLGEALAAQVEDAAAAMFERQAAGERVDYAETVDTLVDSLVRHALENRELTEVCCRYRPLIHRDPHGTLGERHLGIVVRVLEAGTQLGWVHTSDPEMTAYLLDAALSETISDHIAYGEPPDLDRLATAAKELVRKTLAPIAAPAAKDARGSRRRSGAR